VTVARERQWGWPELFIAVQLLWGVVLFLPDVQGYRTYVRALPYVVSGASLMYYFRRETGEPLPRCTKWLLITFALLLLNLLHPTTHLTAGVAQIVFQISIAAPAFWMARAVESQRRLAVLLWVLFLSSLLAAAVGILQVYFPDTFLPSEFSVLARTLNPDTISSLTYVGADGRTIIRPPGLSDNPGGAAVAGMMAMILGLTMVMQRDQRWYLRFVCLVGGAIGMTVLLLTHVRSLALLAAASITFCVVLRFRQGRVMNGAIGAIAGFAVIVGAYLWAVSVGGDAVTDRFRGLVGDGFFRTFDENRGLFIRYTLTELLYEFPLGAGAGRWGMMQLLFGDPTLWQAPPIHVEIQPTGWLLDGGVPLLLVYIGAILAALRLSYRIAVDGTSHLQDLAAALLCVQLAIAGLSLSGPTFNTQLGIQFWAVAGALAGAAGMRRA
jgi:hypothetical protein